MLSEMLPPSAVNSVRLPAPSTLTVKRALNCAVDPFAIVTPGFAADCVETLEELEAETVRWCREMLELSPFALRLLKASFNAAEDGLTGIQQLAHDANLLFYGSEEAQEGRNAYREKRTPDFSRFPKRA